MKSCSLFADGASRGNPGQSSVGVVAFSTTKQNSQEAIFQFGKYIGVKTNNEAEYSSLITGLELAIQHDITEVSVFMDSQLVVYQMQGKYRVKKEHLKKLYEIAKRLEQKIDKISYSYVGREENHMADKLANLALDEYLKRERRT